MNSQLIPTNPNNSQLIIKIQSDQKIVADVFNYIGYFLNHAYTNMDIQVYVENIKDGAVLFFEEVEDFIAFQEFFGILKPTEFSEAYPDPLLDQPLDLFVEVVKLPTGVFFSSLVELTERIYSGISPGISVRKVNENHVIIKYQHAGIFQNVYNLLESKINNTQRPK